MLDYVTSHEKFDILTSHEVVVELGRLFETHEPNGMLARADSKEGK
jgi:hypothetical protein